MRISLKSGHKWLGKELDLCHFFQVQLPCELGAGLGERWGHRGAIGEPLGLSTLGNRE